MFKNFSVSEIAPTVRPPAKLFRAKVSCSLAAACLIGSFSSADAASLILWNRLGSDTEVLNSAVGPNLSFYGGGDIFSVPATPAYVPGVFGNALTIGSGSYSSSDRVHNVVYNNPGISSEHGTVEVWYKQNYNPVDYQNGIYRIFDGGFGLNSGVGLESTSDGLHFNAYFGGTFVDVQSSIAALNNSWIHVAGVWDRNGIDGSSDRIRLYVNGIVVASSASGAWGTTVGTRVDIAGANDYNIVNAFNVDNLKVYDFAMTDFSHRFDENWVVPEPGTGSLLAVGTLLALFRHRQGRAAK